MAFHLSSTTDKIQLVTASAGTIHVNASYTDAPVPLTPTSNLSPADTIPASIATATTTDIVAAPGASTVRNVKKLKIFNADAAVSNLITVQVTNGTNTDREWQGTLLPGESLEFDETGKWTVYASGGLEKLSPGSGSFLQSTVLTSASANFTTSPSTRTIRIRGVAGGGAGAGCTSVAAAASAGGGGGAGGYAEKIFAVQPSTAYAYTCGAAGAGASGAAGGNGGASTFIVGATTVTAQAGQGAPVATAVTTLIAYKGGSQSAVSTNGDLNSAGDPGQMGLIYVAAGAGVSGAGGSGPFGGGGSAIVAAGNGTAALGFGAGGGGALTGASAARTGGNGTAGCWIVDEYT